MLWNLFIFITVSLHWTIAVAADKGPNIRKELQYHRNYQSYNLVPTSPEIWKGVTAGKAESYAIQSRDTLWQLSEVLFGDARFWPKVWALNAEKIENPHEILPGQSLFFTPGSLGQPPSLTVGQTQEGGGTEEAATQAPDPVEEEKRKRAEIYSLANLPSDTPAQPKAEFPPSLPEWAYGTMKPVLDIDVQHVVRQYTPGVEALSFYLLEEKPEFIGEVSETEMGALTVGEFQYIYVKLPGGSKSQRLLVIQATETLKDPVTKKVAHVIEVQGEIEILEAVNASEDIYRAFVKKVISPIRVGSALVSGSFLTFQAKAGSLGTGQARIIGGQNDDSRKLMSINSLVYLAGEGLVEGQSYPIYKQQVLRESKTKSIENPREIGLVKVVKVSNFFSTAVVLSGNEEIRTGDVTDPHMRIE